MAKHHKVYRFRMEPTVEQRQALNRMAGARRWVWNWAIGRRREYYRDFGKALSYKALSAELTVLKTRVETAWLKEAHAQVLQQAVMDVCQAFVNFFQKRARFPKFKSKKRDKARFRIPQNVSISANSRVYVPKIGWVKIRQSQDVTEVTKSATFKRDARGYWFVTLVSEFEMPDIVLLPPDISKVVGIDLGLIDFATLSDNSDSISAPKFYRKAQVKLRRAQRSLRRRVRGSRREVKARAKVARIHQRIANQRGDFLHKLTTKLVLKYDGLCIENLCLLGLARTKLSKSFTDASMGEFRRQLEYKSQWNRKYLVIIDRFFPSSKKCSVCGELNHDLTLSDRDWSCNACWCHHDRDYNAALNIRDEGLRMLAVGQTASLNAQGQLVRPETSGKAG